MDENNVLLHTTSTNRIWFCGLMLDVLHDERGTYVLLNEKRVSVVNGLAVYSELVAASRTTPKPEEKTA